MTQGAVKTTGKRSRAVSAKKKAILSAALDTFSQFGFHGTRLEQIAELAGVSKPICCITSRQKRRCILPCCGRFSISGWHR